MDLFQETAWSGSQFKPPALPEVYVTGMAPIRQRRHHTLKDAGPGFGLSQQQQASILSGAAPIEIGFDFLARDPCKRQGVLRSLHRGVLSNGLWFCLPLT